MPEPQNPKKNIAIIESPKIIEIPIVEEVATSIITQQHTFYIIAGAFAKKKNATRLQAKLNNLNYDAEILSEGKLLKVSYGSFNNKEDAVLALNKIRRANPSAWLLTK